MGAGRFHLRKGCSAWVAELCALTPTPRPGPHHPLSPSKQRGLMRQLCAAAVPQLLFLLEPTAEGGAGGGSSCAGTSLAGALSPPPPLEAWGGLRDRLSGSSHPFGGVPRLEKKWWPWV